MVTKFSAILKERKVFDITNFNVVENKGSFKSVNNPYKFYFNYTMPVQEVGDDGTIKLHKVDFIAIEEVHKRLQDDTHLTAKKSKSFIYIIF